MTGAGPQPGRCGHWWRVNVNGASHVCWEPPGHEGDHVCRIGRCAAEPTTTPREESS